MKSLIAIVLVLFLSSNAYSQNEYQKTNRKDYKLSYNEFISQYGVNDTSIAIINLFFDKREYSGVGKMSFLPLTTSVAVVAPPIGIPLIIISSPLFVHGLLVRQKYSRKNLIIALQNYHNENLLSNKFKKKIYHQIRVQEEIDNELAAEERYLALKRIKTVY